MAKATTSTAKNNPFVAKRVKNLSANFLDCRDPGLRHKWERLNDFHTTELGIIGKHVSGLAREEICERCGTVKAERFMVHKGGTVEKVGTSYTYPEGYQIPGIPRGVTPSTIIYQEQVRRANERAANAAPGERDRAEA